MMREADQDNKYMSKGSNLKQRSNQDKRGRRTEKIAALVRIRTHGSLRHQPPGLNESELATH